MGISLKKYSPRGSKTFGGTLSPTPTRLKLLPGKGFLTPLWQWYFKFSFRQQYLQEVICLCVPLTFGSLRCSSLFGRCDILITSTEKYKSLLKIIAHTHTHTKSITNHGDLLTAKLCIAFDNMSYVGYNNRSFMYCIHCYSKDADST